MQSEQLLQATDYTGDGYLTPATTFTGTQAKEKEKELIPINTKDRAFTVSYVTYSMIT